MLWTWKLLPVLGLALASGSWTNTTAAKCEQDPSVLLQRHPQTATKEAHALEMTQEHKSSHPTGRSGDSHDGEGKLSENMHPAEEHQWPEQWKRWQPHSPYRVDDNHPSELLASLKDAAAEISESAKGMQELFPKYQQLYDGFAGNVLDDTEDLPWTAPPGPCQIPAGVEPKDTCNETEDVSSGSCNFTITNQPDHASYNSSIIPGCGCVRNAPQELFLYCNLRTDSRLVTATTCNGEGTAEFDHVLAAFKTYNDSCSRVGCEDNTIGRLMCRDPFLLGSFDPRATIQFLAEPGSCVHIIQHACEGVPGNNSDTLFISSEAPPAPEPLDAGGKSSLLEAAEAQTAQARQTRASSDSHALGASGMDLLAAKMDAVLQEVTQERHLLAQERQELANQSKVLQALEQRASSVSHVSPVSSAPTWMLMHDQSFGRTGPKSETSQAESHFELCTRETPKRQFLQTASQSSDSSARSKAYATDCDPATQVPVFQPSSHASGTFSIACCAKDALHCAGCAELTPDGQACSKCAGGYVQSENGICEACMNFIDWESATGNSCDAVTCTEEKVNGHSSKEACCQCGGGHRAATPFSYYVGPAVVGATTIVGHPIPRTAERYYLNEDCELLQHGLTISSTTGKLMLSDACSSLGCGSNEAFSVSCTITAQPAPSPRLLSVSSSLGASDIIQWSEVARGKDQVYLDRPYVFTERGDYASSCYFVRGPKQAASQPTQVQWTIKTSFVKDVVYNVYLDSFHNSILDGFTSAWPDGSSWTQSSLSGISTVINSISYAGGPVYTRKYDAGQTITLYGNMNSQTVSYLVFVCPTVPDPEWPPASAKLTVTAHPGFSYGASPLLFYKPGEGYHPETVQSAPFGNLACAPKDLANEVKVNITSGEITWDGSPYGGLSFGDVEHQAALDGSGGGVCQLTQGSFTTPLVMLKPQVWNALDYGYSAQSSTPSSLYVTVGEKTPTIQPRREAGRLAPSRFSAQVQAEDSEDHHDFSFDVFTGVGSYRGHELFVLNVRTGALTLSPTLELVKFLNPSETRSSLRRTFTIYAHYEWPPLQSGPVLEESISMVFWDDTCWPFETQDFAMEQTESNVENEAACRKSCRDQADCSHYIYRSTGDCSKYSQSCRPGTNCPHQKVSVRARYSSCGERTSCIQLHVPNYFYFSGKYCPVGENKQTNGQVFLKRGRTQEDTFWLAAYDPATPGLNVAQCTGKTWMLQATDPGQDFQNVSSHYIELKGPGVACFGDASVTIPKIFEAAATEVSLDFVAADSADQNIAASAFLQTPGCGAPNLTMAFKVQRKVDKVQGPDEVQMLMVDDPATDVVADHWLHPCQCVPHDWGTAAPVTAEAIADIPPDGNAGFKAAPFEIVTGAFTCDEQYLLNILVEPEGAAWTTEYCQEQCDKLPVCTFFWEGMVIASKQCWLYSRCDSLFRSVGLSGTLFAWEKSSKVCRIANAEACWHVTKRRRFLGASQPFDPFYLPDCLFQHLFEQCDQKLMLGGAGVEVCSLCKYAKVDEKGNGYAISPVQVEDRPSILFHPVEKAEALKLRALDKVFVDRGDKFTSLGGFDPSECYYLRGGNDAKITQAKEIQWKVRAPWRSTVYLDFWGPPDVDHEALGFDKWVDRDSWTQHAHVGVEFSSQGGATNRVYTRDYEAGETIVLFGNGANGDSGIGTYLAFVCINDPDQSQSHARLGPGQVLGISNAGSPSTSTASCPTGSYVVACTTFPEQNGYKLVPTPSNCNVEYSGTSKVLAIATCSSSGNSQVNPSGWESAGKAVAVSCDGARKPVACTCEEESQSGGLCGGEMYFEPYEVACKKILSSTGTGKAKVYAICQAASTPSAAKTKLGSAFDHGSALTVSCWTERYFSVSGDVGTEIRCLAGHWLNADGARGLGNFECASAVQVVPSSYLDLARQDKQELYFASRWKFQAFLQIGFVQFSVADCLYAEIPQASLKLRRFRSCENSNLCLQISQESTLSLKSCDPDSTQQLLDANLLSELLAKKYEDQTSNNVLRKGHSFPRNSVRDFQALDIDSACGPSQVLRKLSFGQPGQDAENLYDHVLGMSALCSLANVDTQKTAAKSAKLRVSIENRAYKKCLQQGPCEAGSSLVCLTSDLAECTGAADQLFYFSKSFVDAWSYVYTDTSKAVALRREHTTGEMKNLQLKYVSDYKRLHGRHPGLTFDDILYYGLSQTSLHQVKQSNLDAELENNLKKELEWDIQAVASVADMVVTCPADHVIKDIEKQDMTITWHCSRVKGLGSCIEVTSISEKVIQDLEFLRLLELDCGKDHAMQSFKAEMEQTSLRLKGMCCFVAAPPVTLRPYTGFVDTVESAGVGIYKPAGLDNSGRPMFQQVFSFKPQVPSLGGTLQYARGSGRWCLKGGFSCSNPTDVVHPLDLGSEVLGTKWHVWQLTDFDSHFQGIGAGAPEPPPPQPPQLAALKAEEPEVTEVCKDEFTPGVGASFDKEGMDAAARSLNPEHPCYNIWSDPRTSQEDDQAEGLSWWNREDGDAASTLNDVTYKSVKECADREISAASRQHGLESAADFTDLVMEEARGWVEKPLEALPNLQLPFLPPEIRTGEVAALVPYFIGSGQRLVSGFARKIVADNYVRGDTNDCAPLQHGLARLFCDVFCVRDAVKGGDAAILRTLENAVGTINGNLKLLFDYYLGGNAGDASLLEGQSDIVAGIDRSFEEMRRMASDRLHPAAGAAVSRSLHAFVSRMKSFNALVLESQANGVNTSNYPQGNSSFATHLRAMAGEVNGLHGLVKVSTTTRKLSSTQAVADGTAEAVQAMDRAWQSKVHMLGVFNRAASNSKRRQFWIRTRSQQLSNITMGDVMDELKQHEFTTAVDSVDQTWWHMRQALDSYFDAMTGYWQAFKVALATLDDYTACSVSFGHLKRGYATLVEAHHEGHKALMETWSKANPLIGFLVSQLVDADILKVFAQHDLVELRVEDMAFQTRAREDQSSPTSTAHQGPHQHLCQNSGGNELHRQLTAVVESTLQKGLFGQMLEQIEVAFSEMQMLQARFYETDLKATEPPNQDVLQDAMSHLAGAVEGFGSVQNTTVDKLITEWKAAHC